MSRSPRCRPATLAGVLLFVAWNMGEWNAFRRMSAFSVEQRIKSLGKLSHRSVMPRPAAHGVDRLEAAGRDEPRHGVGGKAVARPLLERRPEGVVQRLFGRCDLGLQPVDLARQAVVIPLIFVAEFVRRRRSGFRSSGRRCFRAAACT